MPNGKDSPLSSEQVRQQVDLVMARWRSYPSFGSLLAALMDANGLSSKEMARRLAHVPGRKLTSTSILDYRNDEQEPPYSFIQVLLDTNVLHFDPDRIRPTGDYRIVLFAAAGLIEVTPESIRQWNQEVLASHRRLFVDPMLTRPRWGDLMAKQLTFHMQGGRLSYDDIAAIRNADDMPVFSDGRRICNLLLNQKSPSERERSALYRFARLDAKDVTYIENGIDSGNIPIGFPGRNTAFSTVLDCLLTKIAEQNITQAQLAVLCARDNPPGSVPIKRSDLPTWRYGRHGITLEKLRSLTAGLKQLGPQRLRDPVTAEEIDHLIAASGFLPRQLCETSHEVIEGIDEHTGIKALLRSLQSAVDLSLPVEEICRFGGELSRSIPSAKVLAEWLRLNSTYPTGQHVHDLLRCLNHLIRRNGFAVLSDEEIGKVVDVAERDYSGWRALSHSEKLGHTHPRSRRYPPSPYFDSKEPGR